MAVNSNRSGTRLLAVLEHIARAQPIGVRELARAMGMEKSAVQRVVTTLAEAGWVQSASYKKGTWELTTRILHVAHLAHGTNTLRERAKPALEALREASGETSYLAIPDVGGLVVVEVAESPHSLRMVIPVGSNLTANNKPERGTALPFLSPQQQEALIDTGGHRNKQEEPEESAKPRYIAGHENDDDVSITLASPVLGADCSIIGVIAVCAVRLRLKGAEQERIGELVSSIARDLSHASRTELNADSIRNAIGGFG